MTGASAQPNCRRPGDCAMSTRFPPQVKYIIGNEACERFSYYGMLSILTLYLKNVMKMSEQQSTEVVHLFATAVYFLPLFGAWLADRWLGRYRTILIISLFYCLGHGALALFEGTLSGIYLGLTLIAIGAGGIKPCVSAFVGDQFGDSDEKLLTRVYGLFYWSINLGAFFGFLLIPAIREKAGYGWAFGVPGIFMALATLFFWMGSPLYVRQPPERKKGTPNILPLILFGLPKRGATSASRFSASDISAAASVRQILLVFAPIPVFWALFNQVNTTWVLQGEKMRPFFLGNFEMNAEKIQSIGALLVLIWVPVLTLGVYPLAEKLGIRLSALRRIGIGVVLASVAFFICAWIQSRIDAGEKISLAWQIIPYIVLEAGEVMVSATALEYAFGQAPAGLKSMMMSIYLMTIAGGHFLVALFTNLNRHYVHATGAAEFLFYAVLMLVVAGVFAMITARLPVSEPQPNRRAGRG